MQIVIGSAWRNSAHRAQRYMSQVVALAVHAGVDHRVRVLAVEGDSKDATREALTAAAAAIGLPLQLETLNHGGPWFGSTEAPERLRALSRVGNKVFESVAADDDVLVYVESDLVWDAHTIGTLIDRAARRDGGFDVFAPLVFAGGNFYDVWGFRGLDFTRFAPFPPYHNSLRGELTEVSSAGSCLVMRGEIARAIRITNDYCLVGWCEQARKAGYRIAVDPTFRVSHL